MDIDESQLCFRCVQTLETSAPKRLECVFTVSSPGVLGGGGDCFCCKQLAAADLTTEPNLSRVIVSFLLNRIRSSSVVGSGPPVKRAAGHRQRPPHG